MIYKEQILPNMTVKNIVYIGYPYPSPHSLIVCNLLLGKICKRDMTVLYTVQYGSLSCPPRACESIYPSAPVECTPACAYIYTPMAFACNEA